MAGSGENCDPPGGPCAERISVPMQFGGGSALFRNYCGKTIGMEAGNLLFPAFRHTVFWMEKEAVQKETWRICLDGVVRIIGDPVSPDTLGVELDMLDVGQGDGIFFSDGDGNYFFIDGGSTNVGNVGTYRILPFLKSKGIAGIGYWFVSHGDADHISGLQEVLESGYPVENLVLAKAMPHDSAYMTLIGIAQEHGTQIRYLDEGDSLGTDQTEFICLYPDYREESGNAGAETTDNMWGDTESADTESADRNALSLVLLLKTEYFSCLFPGDITEAEETKLLADGAFTQVDIYKAAHHGSKYSNSRKYLEKLSPMYALISCSSTNGYGHPGEEAVANMEASGAAVYYTMKQGEITIRPQKNGIEVIPFVGYNVRRQ